MDITKLIPDPEAFLAMHPSQVAGLVLEMMNTPGQRKNWHPANFCNMENIKSYPNEKHEQCLLAMMEAWAFLVNEGLLIPKPEDKNNWHVLSRMGKKIKSSGDFSSYLFSRIYPKESIHPKISEDVYPLFMAGDYETCIFKAFKAVEVAVRQACGPAYEGQFGVPLMRNAFNPETGPLTKMEESKAEREALMNLFAGAIGRFKNPTSHRNVAISSPQETIETLQFASHLLRVVDDRAKV